MLRIYICPECCNFRMVSRNPDAVCLHCGTVLNKCDLEYSTFMNMTEENRNTYKDEYKNRMMLYQEKIETLFEGNHIIK